MVKFFKALIISFVAIAVLAGSQLRASEVSQEEFDKLKKNLQDMQKKLDMYQPVKSQMDKIVDNKYGPGASVKSGNGKLQIGGLVQVWYYSVQNDHRGLFDNPGAGVADTNEASDNDSFRVRRAEISFIMDIHENITAYVMTDFAREAVSYPFFPSNQGNAFLPKAGVNNGVGGVQSGGGFTPAILQDALINYHGIIPHHDVTVGQYLPFFSQEDFGPNFVLDFCERSFVGNHFAREQGLTVHGTWWDNGGGGFYCGGGDNGRFQYWASVFNGAGNYHTPGGSAQSQNRGDDNDDKDFLITTLVRPVWKNETWGSLEFGYAGGFGIHGESGGNDPLNSPVNGLNQRHTLAKRHSAWMSYFAGGKAKGLWIKGEWAYVYDRNAPGFLLTDLTDPTSAQSPNRAFSTNGFYASIGYKIGSSCFCDSSPSWLKGFEFAARYEQYDNVELVNPNDATSTNCYKTSVFTPGINYYIRGQNAKIQLNYNFVDNPSGPAAFKFHDVRNDSLMLGFQVWF